MINIFPTPLQAFQYYDKYSRYDYELGRREHWPETVARTVHFLRELSGSALPDTIYQEIHDGILNLDIMPSMRNLAMAGKAAHRQNACTYNCSYAPIEDELIFYEAVIILMSGTGFGYSVESRYIDKLPDIKYLTGELDHFVIPDTTEGWAEAIHRQITNQFQGIETTFDYSQIRPAGSPLKTKGGRASGASHLRQAHNKIAEIFEARRKEMEEWDYAEREGADMPSDVNNVGRLRSIDVHDIMCHIAHAIVSGGVRRSAMIALFDYDDQLMIECKDGDNIEGNAQRYYSNNSAVWERALSREEVNIFVNRMTDGGSGEPGIFNRRAATITAPLRRTEAEWGTNPCAEIVLRPYQFCNLTSVVCRPEDSLETLKRKTRLATILGTIQSMATNFPNLREEWKINCEEERLLGVDLNGIMDSPLSRDPRVLQSLRETAVRTNARFAMLLGINQSASVTCVKPSGNSSTMLDTSPGLHARWSPYYIRRTQVMGKSPLRYLLQDAGAPVEKSFYVTGEEESDDDVTHVVSFPVKSPAGAITRTDLTALEQCDHWLNIKAHYTEHNPSVTITYQPHEVDAIAEWIYTNQDVIGGMAFLPSFDASYEQMPYEEIDEATYLTMKESFPSVDWTLIPTYENGTDRTNVSDLFACTSDKCLIH